MRTRIRFHVIGVILVSTWLSSCSDSEKNARLEVRLTDAPGDYQEVNIDIQEVQVHVSEGEQVNG